MLQINGKTYAGSVSYAFANDNADLDVMIFSDLSDEDILAVKNAEYVSEVAENYGEPGETVAEYCIVGWRSMSRMVNGMKFRFQTYRTTDIENIKDALFELAAIVGGGNG